MDSASRKRVEQQSSIGRDRTRPKQNRKSLAESPVCTPSSQRKKRSKSAKEEDRFWKLKDPGILQERCVNGRVEYLINWADDEETRESYEPTWEPYKNVTEDEITKWQSREREKESQDGLEPSTQPSIQPSIQEESQESQPIRSATGRRRQSAQSKQGLVKKPRRAGTAETARFQSVSQEGLESQGIAGEIKDSYEEEQLSSHKSGQFRVEVPVHESFDRDAYAPVVASSQPSQPSYSSPYTAQTSSQSQSQFKTPERPHRLASVIWDEDIEGVIPDSQDQAGSLSNEPTDTPTSIIGGTTRSNTENNTLPDPEAIEFRSTQWISSREETHNSSRIESQPLNNHARATYIASQPNSSVQPEASVEAPSEPQTCSSWRESRETQTGNSQSAQDENTPSITSVGPETSQSVSPNFQILSSEEHLVSPVRERGTWSEEARRILSQAQPAERSQPENHTSSNIPFQTQLPFDEDHIDSSAQQVIRDTVGESDERLLSSGEGFRQPSQLFQEPNSQSQTLRPEFQDREFHAPTEVSLSGFEATRDAARVISSTPHLSNQVAPAQRSTHIQPVQQDPPEVGAPGPKSALNQISANTQRSHASSESYSLPEKRSDITGQNSANFLHGELSENVIASIEREADLSSSPLPSFPSRPSLSSGRLQFPDTYGSNLPPRPDLEADMEDRPTPPSAKELLKQARDNAIAKRAAEQAAARASSSVTPSPASTPAPAPASAPASAAAPLENQPLPMRETPLEIPIPVVESAPSVKTSPDAEAIPRSLQILPLGYNEYAVPLPINAITRNIYDQTIRNHRNAIATFIDDEVFDPSLVAEIDGMLKDLEKLCSHQNLIEGDFSTQRLDPDDVQTKWAETISTKCIFLLEFLEALRPFDQHIAIVVRQGRMVEILESLLRHYQYVYRRVDRPEYFGDPNRGPLRITLFPNGDHRHSLEVGRPSIIITFDSSFKSEPEGYFNGLDRSALTNIPPILSLIVTHSIEHLDQCFSKNIEPIERKIRLVQCISQIGDDIGKLSSDYLRPAEAAREISSFIVNGSERGTWPLMPMPEIEGLQLSIESTPETELRDGQPSGYTTQPHNMSSIQDQAPRVKRPLVVEDAMHLDSPKRQRLTPVPSELSNDLDISHVSGAVLQPLSDSANSMVAEAEDVIAKSNSLDEQQETQVSSLLKKISDLEFQLSAKETAEAELRRMKNELESRINDYETSVAFIQPKYQEALNDRGHFEHEIRESLGRETMIKKKHDARVEELTKLKEAKEAADAELAAARTTLATSAIPEVAELEKMRQEAGEMNEKNDRLQKRVTNMQNDLDYMRTNYQNASSSASESASELLSARAEIEILRAKADENRARIHEIQRSNEISELVKRVKQFKAENGELERELEKRGEELKALMNGRRATRGTSVPRSPRMGQGTMSPGPRPIGRVMQMGMGSMAGAMAGAGNNRSRGNSPAPGEFGNRGFGEALFQGQSGTSGRWGNHLQ